MQLELLLNVAGQALFFGGDDHLEVASVGCGEHALEVGALSVAKCADAVIRELRHDAVATRLRVTLVLCVLVGDFVVLDLLRDAGVGGGRLEGGHEGALLHCWFRWSS